MNEKEFIVETIRTQYTEKEITELDSLKTLDKKVKTPANVFAYVFGTVGAIIMGAGMSLVMTDISTILDIDNNLLWGIVIGIIGLFMVIINYPIYKNILAARKKKYADEIISLSDKILNK